MDKDVRGRWALGAIIVVFGHMAANSLSCELFTWTSSILSPGLSDDHQQDTSPSNNCFVPYSIVTKTHLGVIIVDSALLTIMFILLDFVDGVVLKSRETILSTDYNASRMTCVIITGVALFCHTYLYNMFVNGVSEHEGRLGAPLRFLLMNPLGQTTMVVGTTALSVALYVMAAKSILIRRRKWK